MNRQQCANSKINGCDRFVTQRGNILCEICMEKRKNIMKKKVTALYFLALLFKRSFDI